MWLYILPTSTYISKYFSSGLILKNLQSACYLIAFCLSSSVCSFLSLCHFSSTFIDNLCLRKCKSILQLKTECCSIISPLADNFITFVNTDCSLAIIKSCWLNPNFVLNSIAAGVLQSIIVDKASFSWMYIPVKVVNKFFFLSFVFSNLFSYKSLNDFNCFYCQIRHVFWYLNCLCISCILSIKLIYCHYFYCMNIVFSIRIYINVKHFYTC